MNILDAIVAHKQEEIAASKASPRPFDRGAGSPPRDFAGALRRPGLSIIAEIKRRSPSRGDLRADLDVAVLTRQYECGGATALSCLTDQRFFGARPDDFMKARHASTLPILRKDFIIDECQIYEARQMGADAVLLIIRILEKKQLADFLAVSRQLQLAALVEVHDEAELERAISAEADIIGINNRDLDTFAVSLSTSLRIRPLIPSNCTAVAESGISTRADMLELEQAGFDAVLLGESLVRAGDPKAMFAELRGGP